jgi:uncharacterized protein (DUF983 family)
MNIIITINGHRVCPECLHDDLITDLFHVETYCSKCGLVVQDTTITPLHLYDCIASRITELQGIAPHMDIHD